MQGEIYCDIEYCFTWGGGGNADGEQGVIPNYDRTFA